MKHYRFIVAWYENSIEYYLDEIEFNDIERFEFLIRNKDITGWPSCTDEQLKTIYDFVHNEIKNHNCAHIRCNEGKIEPTDIFVYCTDDQKLVF